MLTIKRTIFLEAAFALIIGVPLVVLDVNNAIPPTTETFLGNIVKNLFELNNVIAIAFLISLIAGKEFVYKGRSMKRIARNSTVIFLANSVIVAVFGAISGANGLALVVPAFFGNLLKFYDISKNILNVL